MKPPFILNENSSIEHVGDLDVFESVSALETYIEPWYVDEPHFIFDSDGMQLEITPSGHNVRLVPKEPRSFSPEVARKYFAAFLNWQDRAGVADFVQTATLSELATASAKFATR